MAMTQEEIQHYCTAIYRIVGERAVERAEVSPQVIRDYYAQSAFYYRKFHSPEGAMHMPIAFAEGASHREKLRYQADYIEGIIREAGLGQVLELGCGMGFNTQHLANRNPGVHFTGIDLTPGNIDRARQQSRSLANVSFYPDDFDQPRHQPQRYDLIFAVETLCHSRDLPKLLLHFTQRLNPGGRMVIFDGYVKPGASALATDWEQKAYQLLSWGFALDGFQDLEQVLGAPQLATLHVDPPTEYTANILSNYRAFYRGAKRALRFPGVVKFLLRTRLLSPAFVKQLAAGLFGLHFMKRGYLGYYKLELRAHPQRTASA